MMNQKSIWECRFARGNTGKRSGNSCFTKVLYCLSWIQGQKQCVQPSLQKPMKQQTIIVYLHADSMTIKGARPGCCCNQSSSNFPERDTPNAKAGFWSRTFSMICLILATCVWRSFRFCKNISRLVYHSVFKFSSF